MGRSKPIMLWPTIQSAFSIHCNPVWMAYLPPIGSSLGLSEYFSSLNDSVLSSSPQWSARQCILDASFRSPFVSRSNTIVPTPVVGFIDELGLFNCFLRWWFRFIQIFIPWMFIMFKNLRLGWILVRSEFHLQWIYKCLNHSLVSTRPQLRLNNDF